MRYGFCGFFTIKPQTALHHAMRYIVTCGMMQLCHFAGDFGAVYAVWWTPLIKTLSLPPKKKKKTSISYFLIAPYPNILYKYIYIYKKGNSRDTKNFITFATTCHVASYEWWKYRPTIWHPSFTTCYLIN